MGATVPETFGSGRRKNASACKNNAMNANFRSVTRQAGEWVVLRVMSAATPSVTSTPTTTLSTPRNENTANNATRSRAA